MMKKMILEISKAFAGQPHRLRVGYFKIILYLLLIAIGFVYLYPLLFMLATSMKSPGDLLNLMVQGSQNFFTEIM